MSLSDPVDVRNTAIADRHDAVSDERRRATMLEHPTLAVASIERGRIRVTNAPWQSLFAMPADVSSESHVATLFPNAASADRFERGLQAELISREAHSTARLEHMLVRRDGRSFLAEVVVSSPRPGADAGALGGDAIWQVRDITVERTLRRELRDLEEYHRELSRHQDDCTFVIDRKGRISYASSSIEHALGYRVPSLLGQAFASLFDPLHATEAEQWLRAASRRESSSASPDGACFALRLRHEDGTVRTLQGRALDCFALSRIAGMVVQARARPDVGVERAAVGVRRRTALLELAGAMRTDERPETASLLRRVMAETGTALVVLWKTMDGAPRPVVVHRSSSEASPETATAASLPLPPLLAAGEASTEPRVVDDVHADPAIGSGERTAFDASSIGAVVQVPVLDDGESSEWLVVGAPGPRTWADADIDFVVGAAVLVGASTRAAPSTDDAPPPGDEPVADPLTGLPGRAAALRDLGRLLDALRSSETLVLIAVGIDRLRDVNDMRGFAAGDAVIASMAEALRAAIGDEGFVARTGGDEFLVVLRTPTATRADASIQAVIDSTDRDDAESSSRAASLGITRFAFDGTDAAALMLQADLALREAKGLGGHRACVHHQKLALQLRTRRELDGEIETALANDEFTLFYQPQVALATGAIVGMEALLRWQHPTRGLLLPHAFIEAAFTRGLHEAITKWVLTQVCEQLAAWRRAGDVPEVPVAVNVEGRQFHDRRLPALVASALLKSGLPARLLLLDVKAQSLATDDAGLERVVRELARLGVRVAISDFSVGHASFRSLRKLQVAQVKLDGGFVGCLPDDHESALVVASFVELAHRLKYQVVAEGVETLAQFEHLRDIGCEVGQGFHLGAPLSAAEIRSHLVAKRRS